VLGSLNGTMSGSALHTGFVGGIGIEHAFLGNWTAKAEYNYIGFRQQPVMLSGLRNFDIAGAGTGAIDLAQREEIRQHLHLVKFGINCHFAAGPDVVTARY
jgi:opacity protein-like surface antigen